MTSRDRLGAAPRPDAGLRHARPAGPGTPAGASRYPRAGTGRRRTPAAGAPLSRAVPLILLIALVIVGLRGAAPAFRWDGPFRRDWLAVGLAVEAVLAALLAVVAARARRSPPEAAVAAKLRTVLMYVLGAGMAAVAALLLLAAHLHTFARPVPPHTAPRLRIPPKARYRVPRVTAHAAAPLEDILWGLLAVIALAAAVLAVRWLLRHRPVPGGEPDLAADEDGDEAGLREAVESGRTALRQLDDARAAIIACYVAMEQSLAEAGAARSTAETPDELLARATTAGVVRGTAAGRLTALFYEARFSTHPLDRAQRDAAERALGELAAGLREPAATAAGEAP